MRIFKQRLTDEQLRERMAQCQAGMKLISEHRFGSYGDLPVFARDTLYSASCYLDIELTVAARAYFKKNKPLLPPSRVMNYFVSGLLVALFVFTLGFTVGTAAESDSTRRIECFRTQIQTEAAPINPELLVPMPGSLPEQEKK